MSNRIAMTPIFVIGLIALAWVTQYTDRPKPGDLSGIDSKKMAILKPHREPAANHTEKVRGPLTATINATAANNVITLQGTVTSTRVVNNLLIHWHLPKGVEQVGGPISQTVATVGPGAPFSTQITVRQTRPGNKHIHFYASAGTGPTGFSSVSQYSTQPNLIVPVGNLYRTPSRAVGPLGKKYTD